MNDYALLGASVKILFVIQHPRRYALEVANERSDLPDSELYLQILKEYVQDCQGNLVFSLHTWKSMSNPLKLKFNQTVGNE